MKHVATQIVTRPVVAVATSALLGLSGLAWGQGAPAVTAPHPQKAETPAQIKSKGSYSLGLSVGESLRRMSIDSNAISTPRVMQGIQDALSGKAQFGPDDEQSIRTMLVAAHDRVLQKNHAAARAFLARNGKKKGVVTTASGLEYLVLKAGEGASPKSGDIVTVNYRGTLLDGTEFDSSYKRRQPATFPVDRVITGWQEALKLMNPGAQWRLFVPPQLAYDSASRPPIPPGSLLVFEVNLLSVQPPPPPPTPPTAPTPPAQPHP